MKKIPQHFDFDTECDIQAESDEGESLPTFKMLANTGKPMRLRGFYDPVVVNLSGVIVANGGKIPILYMHDISKIVGHATEVTVGKNISAVGVISADTEEAKAVISSSKNGFPWQATIGASIVPGHAQFIAEKETAKVNGKTFKGPLIVANKIHLREISFTPLGADGATSVSISAGQNTDITLIGAHSMPFDKFVSDLGFKVEDLSETQQANLQAKFDAEEKAIEASKAAAVDTVLTPEGTPAVDIKATTDAHSEALAANIARSNKLQLLASDDTYSTVEDLPAKLEAAVKNGTSPNEFELDLRRSAKPKAAEFAVHNKNVSLNNDAIEAAMLMDSGLVKDDEIAAHYSSETREKVMNLAASRDYRGFGLHRLGHEVIRATGGYYPSGKYDNDFIRSFKAADQKIQAAGDFATVNISGILSSLQNKMLLASFGSNDQALERISSKGSAKDFKTMNSYRLTGMGEFKEVGAAGELESISLDDDTYTNQLKTYGAKLGLNRVDILNDDLGALTKGPQIIGRMSRMKLMRVAFKELMTLTGFFTAGNGNHQDGAGTALDIDSLAAAKLLGMQLKDANGDPADVSFDTLLVGSANAIVADNLFKEKVVNQTPASNKKSTNNNPHVGMYQPVATPWLDTGNNVLSGAGVELGSATHWWLLSSEAVATVLQVLYLNGQSNPTIELNETPPDVLGMQWTGYFDFGVAKQEYRGGIYSKGAA